MNSNHEPANNIWSDEISLDDFFSWSGLDTFHRDIDWPEIVPMVEGLAGGEGLPYPLKMPHNREAYTLLGCFYSGKRINFATDFNEMKDEANQFNQLMWQQQPGIDFVDRHCSKHNVTEIISKLQKYKVERYSIILRKRVLERQYAFLASVKRPESTSSVFGKVAVQGVLKIIFSFAQEKVETTHEEIEPPPPLP